MAKIKIGMKAPNFSLRDSMGVKHNLKEYMGKDIILYFYPKDMTPGCTIQACDFRDSIKTMKRPKAIVIGISKDSTERHRKFTEKYDLNFTLLSDEDGRTCEAYEVIKEKVLYGRRFKGIERTTFIIDKHQKIRHIFAKVKVKEHVEQVWGKIVDGKG